MKPPAVYRSPICIVAICQLLAFSGYSRAATSSSAEPDLAMDQPAV